MQLFYQPGLANSEYYLSPDESKHCIKVLRKQLGDLIHVTDGKGLLANATITSASHKKCTFDIETQQLSPSPTYHNHIAIAPTKNIDRILWFVEKSIEIGIQEISFFYGEHSERTILKSDRIFSKAISAMKQSMNLHLPRINELVKYEDIIHSTISYDEKYIAYVDGDNEQFLPNLVSEKSQTRIVLIGPEGDFNTKELNTALANGFTKVSLGKSRLRTETAGIVACTMLNLV